MAIKKLCLFTIFTTFILLLWGGTVHNTESSLACPDWPLCYGQFFPPMKGGILIEHGHRMLASLVGLLTIALVLLARGIGGEISKLARLSLAFVIIQGLIGGITVTYKLPTIASSSHLALSMIFFATLILLYHRLCSADSFGCSLKSIWKPSLREGIFFSGLLLYVQMILGAFMRHSGAGAACGLGTSSSAYLCWDKSAWALVVWPSLPPAQLHMLHRYFGVVVAALLIFYAVKSILLYLRTEDSSLAKILFWLPLCLIVLLFTQIFLGVATVFTSMGVVPTTAHLGVGALCLAVTWYFYLKLDGLERALFGTIRPSLTYDLLAMTKPKLGLLVISTVFIGLLLSPSKVDFFSTVFSLLMIWGVVAGAAVLNCYFERDTDALMDRTKDRGLPAGRVEPRHGLIFGSVLLAIFTAALAIWVNLLTAGLALLAAILYLFVYTPLKSKSLLAVYIGAVSGALPPMLGYVAVENTVGSAAWCLFAIMFVWQLPHFFAISISYRREYHRAKTKIYPNTAGIPATVLLMVAFTAVLVGCSLLPFHYAGASLEYRNCAMGLGAIFLIFTLRGIFLQRDEERITSWARGYFWCSIFYLPLLLGAIVFLK